MAPHATLLFPLLLALSSPLVGSFYFSHPARLGLPERATLYRRTPAYTLLRDADKSVPEDALSNAGWGGVGELTSDDPFVLNIDDELQDIGGLSALLNPATVINCEKQVVELRLSIADACGIEISQDLDFAALRKMDDENFDDPQKGGEKLEKLRQKLDKVRGKLNIERRSVFRGWLKNLFLGQAVISFVLSFVMATEPSLLFGSFGWFNDPTLNLDVTIKVLGFWWWWLFIIPSLRSRRPSGIEKQALDIAFLATPAVSLISPALTKDTTVIWFINLAATLLCFAYATVAGEDSADEGAGGFKSSFIYKALDFGVGKERGVRK